jgi:DNA-binding transcriptional MocR family regulator
MTTPNPKKSWLPALAASTAPIYQAIADALGQAIETGELADGQRLPAQRTLAAALNVDFTTVSRAYAEAQRRGLVEGRVGQGTYVTARATVPRAETNETVVDMSLNHPPLLHDKDFEARLFEDFREIGQHGGLDLLRRYLPPEGSTADRLAGVQWLHAVLPGLAVERVLVCAGTQGALLAVANMLARPGDAICVDALTHVGFRLLAHRLGIRLVPVAGDKFGMLPEAFEAACLAARPKALYCMPTLHNPNTITLSLARRQGLVEVARRHGVPIIEDDNYWQLTAPRAAAAHKQPPALPPLAALAPELVYHVSGLAKCLAPALRVAYVVAPDARSAERLASVVRATSSMVSSLTAALASKWIGDGTADKITAEIQREAGARQDVARRLLGPYLAMGDRRGFHLWLPLPAPWTRSAFTSQLRRKGILVTESDAFTVAEPPEAVRICLGAPSSADALAGALARIADLLSQSSSIPSGLV